eukprot:195479_1
MDFMNSLIILIICYAQRQHCYDFTAHGTVDLNKDDGWSQFGAACVGFLETSNFSTRGTPAGTVNIKFTVPFNAPKNDTEYILVMYDDQNNSFPKVNNTYMSCEEKVDGDYKRLEEINLLLPGISWETTVLIHQHIRTRWWYFYLVNCDESLTFVPISYVYSYKDNTNDTQICAKPSNVTTTLIPINGTKTHGTQSMIRALIGVIVIIFIGLCVVFGVKYRKKHRMKQKKENLLMHSLNEEEIIISNELYDLLKEWSLEQYGNVLIEERGYDDMGQWKDLTENDLEQMGFKEGHARRFVTMVKENCMDLLVETQVLDTEVLNEVNMIQEGMVNECNEQNEGEEFTNQ